MEVHRQARRAHWRLPILFNSIGLGTDQHVQVLKEHIADAGLSAPEEKLDLVVIQDLEHLGELMADGIPMARGDDAPDPLPGAFVQMPRRRFYWILVLAVAAPGPASWAILLSRALLG